MKFKFFLGAGLILGLLCFCVAIGIGIRRMQEPVSQQVEQAIRQAEAGALILAEESIQAAKTKWEDYRDRLASFSDHDPIDDIDILLDQLAVRVRKGTVSDFLADCKRLQALLLSITQDHTLKWWNLLSSVI